MQEDRRTEMPKYIVRRFGKGFAEKRANSLLDAIKIRKQLKVKEPDSYCHIVKVPFRKRHPDFPIWFSTASLLLVAIAPEVDSCTRYILRIMQLWK